jgi:hypothetical protein
MEHGVNLTPEAVTLRGGGFSRTPKGELHQDGDQYAKSQALLCVEALIAKAGRILHVRDQFKARTRHQRLEAGLRIATLRGGGFFRGTVTIAGFPSGTPTERNPHNWLRTSS